MSLVKYTATAGLSMAVAVLDGCSFSPSVNVAGSYFPAWIICCLVGAAVAALTHWLFTRWKLLDELWSLPLLYPCLICFVSCILWLTLFQ